MAGVGNEGQVPIPIRTRGSSKCPYHAGNQVIYVCEYCTKLACVTCVASIHKGHELEEISYGVPNAKRKLQEFINKSENNEIPRLTRHMRDVDSAMSQNKQYYQQEVSRIEQQHEILKEQLEKAKKKLVKSYRDMEKHDMDILQNHKTVLQAHIDERSSRIQECKDTLQSGNDVQFHDVSSDLPSELKDIPAPTMQTPPQFILANFTFLQLENLLGEVTRSKPRVIPKQPTANCNAEDSIFTPFKEHWVKSMHPESSKKVWINLFSLQDNEPMRKILLINHKGEVQKTLDMEIGVHDFCLSPWSGIPWFCGYGDCNIREARGGEGGGSVVRFKTDTLPCCICLTADNHVVVGHVGEVVKYTQTGKPIQKTPGGDEPLVIYPFHISQCPKSANLAVVDLENQKYGGCGQPVVLILDEKLTLLNRYHGDTRGRNQLALPFNPYDVCYTAKGNLAITDNRVVLHVSEKGKYQKTLNTHKDLHAASVCVHRDGVLWVSSFNGSVQLLKSE